MNRKKYLITSIITTSFLLVCCAPKVQPVEPNDEETSYSNFDNKIIKRVKKNASKEVEITLIRNKQILSSDFDQLDYNGKLNAGDVIQITSDYKYVLLDLFEGYVPSLVYLPHGDFAFKVPDSNESAIYKTNIFSSNSYSFKAHIASESEMEEYGNNLTYNPYDFMRLDEVNNQDVGQMNASLNDSISVESDEVGAYPHAYANRVTRNEVGFYARNAIDGLKENEGHGNYPYQSWGYNQKDDAVLTIYFGREVNVDQVDITLRADYSGSKEHDSYWDEATLCFSNGEEETINLQKGKDTLTFEFDNKKTSFIQIRDIKTHTSSNSENFAALTEIEAKGENNFKNEPIEEKVYISRFGAKKMNKVSTKAYKSHEIKEVIEMTNDWFINVTSNGKYTQPDYNGNSMAVNIDDSNWKDAVFYSGLTDYYLTSGNTDYLYLLRGMFEKLGYQVNGGKATPHGDWYQIGESYLIFEDYLGGQNKGKDALRNADYNLTRSANDLPTSGLCNYYDTSDKTDWSHMGFWWCDALYMALNTYSLLYLKTGEDKYVESAFEGYQYFKEKLYNEEYDLWWRDASQIPLKTSSNKPLFWSRGNGWVAAALAKQLLYLDKGSFSDYYDIYLEDYQKMMESLIKYQRDDGLWDSSIIDHDYYGGKETTGTSGFLYAICTGLELGYLDKATYLPAAEKAYEGLLTCLIKENGEYTGQMGYMQTTGYQPQNYKNEEYSRTITTEFGQGLWTLGASAFMRLCEDYSPKELRVITSAR